MRGRGEGPERDARMALCRLAAAAIQVTTQLSGDEDEDDYAFKVSLNPKPGTPAIERRGEMPKP